MSKTKQYWISFVEEYWPGQLEGTTIGRVEVYEEGGGGNEYAIEEIRWGTFIVDEFNKLREEWDWQEVTKKELNELKKQIKKFQPKEESDE